MADEKWPASKVVKKAVADLVPYARNARTHSDSQVDQIAASIREWGWTVPVLVDENDGILAGHGRILAAQKLGIEKVPAMVASGWSESQKRAYVIADNRLAERSEWDFDTLIEEASDLLDNSFDLDLVGFTFDEIELLNPGGGEDEFPNTAPGDGGQRGNRKTDDGYAEFNVILTKENKSRLLRALQSCRETHGTDSLEDTVMAMAGDWL